MTVGAPAGKGVVPQMNVTPLVDVVLVLLIIFMVITPLLAKNFWVHLPKQDKEEVTRQQMEADPTPPLVLRVGPGRTIQVNGLEVPFDEGAAKASSRPHHGAIRVCYANIAWRCSCPAPAASGRF